MFIDRIGAGDYESGLKTGRKLVVPCGKCSSVQYRLRNRMHGSLNSQLRSRLVSEVFVRHNKAHFKSTKHSPHPSRACPTLTRSRKSAHEDVLTYIVRYNIRIRTVTCPSSYIGFRNSDTMRSVYRPNSARRLRIRSQNGRAVLLHARMAPQRQH